MALYVKQLGSLTDGMHADGNGLYLQVSPRGRSWIFRFQLAGRRREMGLGSLAEVGLAGARDKAYQARRLVAAGQDPIEARKIAAKRLADSRAVTFRQAAESYIDAAEAGWHNAKHRNQWRNTLRTYAYPVLGPLPLTDISTEHVLQVLKPIWTQKPETASRVRGRIERVLSAAKAQGLCSGENPAAWRGHLSTILPARSDVRVVRHYPAVPYAGIPALMMDLARLRSVSARALEFTILTAVRTNQVVGMTWDEIDLDAIIWTCPPERMKGKKSKRREHRIPLSDAALTIIKEMAKVRVSGFVFPGWKRGAPLSNMAMLQCLRGIRPGFTVHGTARSAFKDWAAERTHFANIVSEAALAHVIADKTEGAYRRGDLFEKRQELMQAWSNYCRSGANPRPKEDNPQVPRSPAVIAHG